MAGKLDGFTCIVVFCFACDAEWHRRGLWLGHEEGQAHPNIHAFMSACTHARMCTIPHICKHIYTRMQT